MAKRILRIPTDMFLLTFHYFKGILWLVNYVVKSILNFPQTTSFPYGCFTEKTTSGHNTCLPGKKYGNPVIFKSLCPDCKRIRLNGVETYCLTTLLSKHNYWRPSLFRLVCVGAFLSVFWTSVGFGFYHGLRVLLPQPTKAALRSKLGLATSRNSQNVPLAISTEDKKRSTEFLDRANNLANSRKLEEAILEYRNALKKNPFNSDALFALGECLLKLNRETEALEVFNRCVQLDGSNWRVHKQLGILLLRHGKIDKAMEHAKKIVEIEPNSADAYLVIGACLHKNRGSRESVIEQIGKAKNLLQVSSQLYQIDTYLFAGHLSFLVNELDLSEFMYRKALELDPELTNARIGLATIFSAKSLFDQAKAEVNRILESDAKNVKALVCLAEIDVLNGKIPKAIESLENILKIKPENISVLVRQAELLISMGQSNEAYKKLQRALEQNPKNPRALVVLAKMYMEKNLYTKAIEHATTAIEAENDYFQANVILAKAHLAQKDYDKTILLIKNLLTAYPENFELILISAVAHQALNKRQEAITLLNKASEINPQSVTPYINLGGLYYDQGELDLAVSSYEKVLEIVPDHPIATNNLAMLLLENKKDSKYALELAKRLKKLYPENPYIDDTLGWAHYHIEDYEKAQELFLSAAQKRPDSPVIRYHLAEAMFKQGNLKGAHLALTNAFNISKDFAGATKAAELLAQIKKNMQ